MIKTTTYRPRRVTKVVTTKRDIKGSRNSGQTKKKKRNRKRKVNHNRKLVAEMHDEVMLVANPCHGPISRTIGSGAITERVRSTISVPAGAANTSGYIVWFPSYHNGGDVFNASNIFYFENPASNVVPANTAANPLGMVSPSTTGFSSADPAFTPIISSVFSRGKTHSACLQVDYVGALSAVSGQVAIIKNFPLRGLFSQKSTVVITAPTVDTLFAYAAERERIQITGHEVIWRPTDESSIFRTCGNDRPSGALAPDTAWINGVVGSTSSTLSSTDSDEMYGICIAWKGIPATAGVLSISCVKVVSLELAPSGTSIESPVVTDLPSSLNPMSTITSWLDKYSPGWQTSAINTTANVTGQLAKAYAPKALQLMSNGLRGRSRLLLTDL